MQQKQWYALLWDDVLNGYRLTIERDQRTITNS